MSTLLNGTNRSDGTYGADAAASAAGGVVGVKPALQLFPVISSADWGRALLRFRTERNLVREGIRARVAALGLAGIPKAKAVLQEGAEGAEARIL